MPAKVVLVYDYSALPERLRSAPFVLWRAVPDGGRTKKLPLQTSGRLASTTHSATWTDYVTACTAYRRGTGDGIGIVLTGDGLHCIDIDHAIDGDGELSALATRAIDACRTWTEVSQSGTGLHLFGIAAPGAAIKTPVIELYSTGRFIALTAHTLCPLPVADIAVAVQRLRTWHSRRQMHAGENRTQASAVAVTDASGLLSHILARDAVARSLFSGDIGNASHSEADMRLALRLVWWTGRDLLAADCMFRKSALMRDKWDSVRGETTYGAATLVRANSMLRTAKGERS